MSAPHYKDEQVRDARFEHVELKQAVFDGVDLTGSTFSMVDLADVSFTNVAFRRVTMKGVELEDVAISGELRNVTVNGIEVWPLVEAELDRLHPERPALRPTDAEGYREAWRILGDLWDGTVERARRLPPEALHESVAGEWSFTQTLRHLAFASNSWVGRGLLRQRHPFHPLDLPWGEFEGADDIPNDVDARPSLDEALAVRGAAQEQVRQYLATLTDERLASTEPAVEGPGWPPPIDLPVKECLDTVINEEWWHRQYAERDLAVLESR